MRNLCSRQMAISDFGDYKHLLRTLIEKEDHNLEIYVSYNLQKNWGQNQCFIGICPECLGILLDSV